jgi:dTMP kinase
MKIDLASHGLPGTLVAICGFDGSGKSTLEAALLAAITPTRPCVPAWAPTEWWRQDANVTRTLFGKGDGQVLPEEALLHFNLADCHVHQAATILPALARGEVVIGNRYLFDMLALFEARGLALPGWLPEAVDQLVRPDFCFVLDGAAGLMVDRLVRRDGAMPGRFDQNVAFVERYNAALRRMAEENHLTVLRAEAQPDDIVRQCLDVFREARWH